MIIFFFVFLREKGGHFIIGSIADTSNVRGPSNWISAFVSLCAKTHRSTILTDNDFIFFPFLSLLTAIFRMDAVSSFLIDAAIVPKCLIIYLSYSFNYLLTQHDHILCQMCIIILKE